MGRYRSPARLVMGRGSAELTATETKPRAKWKVDGIRWLRAGRFMASEEPRGYAIEKTWKGWNAFFKPSREETIDLGTWKTKEKAQAVCEIHAVQNAPEQEGEESDAN